MDGNAQARSRAVQDRLREAMKEELDRGDVSAEELLAIFAYMTGGLIALQDSRKMSAETAIRIVNSNVEHGNAAAIQKYIETHGGKH